jgi:hypothetical protein
MRSAIFYTPVIFARVRRQIFRDVPQFNALFLRDFYSRNAEQFPLWLAILGVFGIKRRHLAYPLLAAARKRAAKYSDRQALLKGIEHAAEYRHDISYLRRQEMSRKENVGLLDVFDQIAQLGYCFSAPEFLVKRMRNVDFREGVTDKITAFILFVRAIKIISSKRDRVIPDAAPAFFVARETRLLEDMLKPVLMEAQDSLAHLFFHIHHNIPLDTELKPLVRSYNKLRNILLGWYEHELRRAARQKNRAKGVLLRAMVAWYSDSLTSWIDRFWWSEQMHEEKKADEKKLEAMEKAISRIRTFLLAAKLLKEVRLYLDRNHVNMYSPHSRFADNTDAGAYLTEFPFVLHSFNQHIPAVCKPRAGGVFPGRKIGINQGRINQDKSGTATIIFRTGTGKTKSRRAGVRWDK